MLHRASVLTIACVATALGGCAATYPTYVMAPCQPPPASGTPSKAAGVEESELSSANEPQPRPRAASRATAARLDGGEAAPSQHPYYSPEWSKEQEREDEPLKRAVNNICRGC